MTDQQNDVFGVTFFSTPGLWADEIESSETQTKTARGKGMLAFAIAAGLAVATVALSPTDSAANELFVRISENPHATAFAGPVVSPKDAFGHQLLARPENYFAMLDSAGSKAKSWASRVLFAATELGAVPTRVTSIGKGGIGIYWLSKQQLPGGAAARFALFECEKDGLHLVLSNHTPEGVEVFEGKVSNFEQLVQRAIEYTA